MARSHKEFRHVFAGQQPVTDLGGGNVHYRGVDDLDVVGAEKGLFKASHSVRGNFFGIKYIRCGKILALLDQPMPDAIHIVPLVRVDRHSIFGKYSREIPPARMLWRLSAPMTRVKSLSGSRCFNASKVLIV